MKDVDALILCGGQGTRLRSIIADKPKVLAPVNGRPFLSYLLDQLIIADFHRVILCIGYKGEMVRDTFGPHYKGLNIRYSHETEPLGTGGALRYALPMIEGSYILAMNGDSYIDADICSFIEWYLKGRYDASILLTNVEDTSRYGKVDVREDCLVTFFGEKCSNHGSGWINAGMYLFNSKLLETIPEHCFFSLEKEFISMLVGDKLYGYLCYGDFIDIGTPNSYTKSCSFFSKS